jgi:hypothetical protein
MGWRDRDYAKWTDESVSATRGTGTAVGSGSRPPRSGMLRPGVGAAVLASATLFALGHFLHFRLLDLGNTAAAGSVRPPGTINTPSTAALGSKLTFDGSPPAGNGPVACNPSVQQRADAGTRTPDPIITSDVLYQLSYVGGGTQSSRAPTGPSAVSPP